MPVFKVFRHNDILVDLLVRSSWVEVVHKIQQHMLVVNWNSRRYKESYSCHHLACAGGC